MEDYCDVCEETRGMCGRGAGDLHVERVHAGGRMDEVQCMSRPEAGLQLSYLGTIT